MDIQTSNFDFVFDENLKAIDKQLTDEARLLEGYNLNIKSLLNIKAPQGKGGSGVEQEPLPVVKNKDISLIIRTLVLKSDGLSGIDIFSKFDVSESVPVVVFCDTNTAAESRENFEISKAAFEYPYAKASNAAAFAGVESEFQDKRHYFKTFNPLGLKYSNTVAEAARHRISQDTITSLKPDSFVFHVRESDEEIRESAEDAAARNIAPREINYFEVKMSGNGMGTYEITFPDSEIFNRENIILSIVESSLHGVGRISKAGDKLVKGYFNIAGKVVLNISPDVLYVFVSADIVMREFLFTRDSDKSFSEKVKFPTFYFLKDVGGADDSTVGDEGGEDGDATYVGSEASLTLKPSGLGNEIRVECKCKSKAGFERLALVLPYLLRYYSTSYVASREFIENIVGPGCCTDTLIEESKIVEKERKGVEEADFPPTAKTKIANIRNAGKPLPTKYSVDCMCPIQPVVIGADEIDQWKPNVIAERDGVNYICPSEKTKYPIFKSKGDDTDYPCCFASPEKGGETAKKQPTITDYILQKFTSIDYKKRGKVTETISRVINAAYFKFLSDSNQTFQITKIMDLVRLGVSQKSSKDSAIRSVLYATQDERFINAFRDDRMDEMDEITATHRSEIITKARADIYAQEFYDCDPSGASKRSGGVVEAFNKSIENGESLETYMHYRGIEDHFGINLYVFTKVLTPECPVNGNTAALQSIDLMFETPSAAGFHIRRPGTGNKTVILVAHISNPKTNVKHYEPIMSNGHKYVDIRSGDILTAGKYTRSVTASSDLVYSFPKEVGNFFGKILTAQIGANIGVNNVDVFGLVNDTDGLTIKSQHIDMFGKSRGIRFLSSDKREFVATYPPTQPYLGVSVVSEASIYARGAVINLISKNARGVDGGVDGGGIVDGIVYNTSTIPFSSEHGDLFPVYAIKPSIFKDPIFSEFQTASRAKRIGDTRMTEILFVQYFMWVLATARYATAAAKTEFVFEGWWKSAVNSVTGVKSAKENSGTPPPPATAAVSKFPNFSTVKDVVDSVDNIQPPSIAFTTAAISEIEKRWPAVVKDGKFDMSTIGGGHFEKIVKTFSKQVYNSTQGIEYSASAKDIIPTDILGVMYTPQELSGGANTAAVFTSSEAYNSWCLNSEGGGKYVEIVSVGPKKQFAPVAPPFKAAAPIGFGGLDKNTVSLSPGFVEGVGGGVTPIELYNRTGTGGLSVHVVGDVSADRNNGLYYKTPEKTISHIYGSSAVVAPLDGTANEPASFALETDGSVVKSRGAAVVPDNSLININVSQKTPVNLNIIV